MAQEIKDSSWQPLEGGCRCGKIRFKLTRSPIIVNCCHCRWCQQRTGSAFALNAIVEKTSLVVISEEKPTTEAAPNPDHGSTKNPSSISNKSQSSAPEGGPALTICPFCKIMLWVYIPFWGPNISCLRVGALDQGEELQITAHYFVRSKHPWVMLPEGVKAFETLPTADDPMPLSPEAIARVEKSKAV